MKINLTLAMILMTLTMGCATQQGPITTSPLMHEDGSFEVVAPRGLTLGSPLKSQAYFDRLTLYKGTLKIGYHLGYDREMGMRNLKTIHGDIYLELDFFTTHLFFPSLEKVTGNIVITSSTFGGMPPVSILEMLDFRSLKEVGGDIVFRGIPQHKGAKINKQRGAIDKLIIPIGDRGLEVASFPSLETVGGQIRFEHTAAFTGIEMPLLTSVGGGLSVSSSPRLTYMLLTQLKKVTGEISITNNELLASVDLSSLEEAAAIDVTDNNFINNQPIDLKLGAKLKGSAQID